MNHLASEHVLAIDCEALKFCCEFLLGVSNGIRLRMSFIDRVPTSPKAVGFSKNASSRLGNVSRRFTSFQDTALGQTSCNMAGGRSLLEEASAFSRNVTAKSK